MVWIVQLLEATVPRRYRPGGLVIDFRLAFKHAYDCYELFRLGHPRQAAVYLRQFHIPADATLHPHMIQ